MLTKKEKQEEINYQINLIKNDNNFINKQKKYKGHLTLLERDKITVLYAQNYSISSIF